MPIVVSDELKAKLKEQRLNQLSSYYYELQMNKAAYEANGKTEQAAEVQRLMDETQTSYDAISAMQ